MQTEESTRREREKKQQRTSFNAVYTKLLDYQTLQGTEDFDPSTDPPEKLLPIIDPSPPPVVRLLSAPGSPSPAIDFLPPVPEIVGGL